MTAILRMLVIIFTLVILSCSGSTEPPPYDPFGRFSIQADNPLVFQDSYATASLMLDSLNSTKLIDFSILIAYDTNALTMTHLTIGEAFTCWDNFEFGPVIIEDCGDDCPPGLIRITASMGSANISGCDGWDGEFTNYPIEIAKLRFFVTDDRDYECTLAPLYFYWIECEDNRINLSQSSMQYFSRHVYRAEKNGTFYDSSILIPPDGTIDADDHIYGATPDCLIQIEQSMPPISLFNLDFHNGGLDIACAMHIDGLPGDVDLNGIPYELDDVNLLADYLVDGSAVLTENPSLQLDNANVILNNTVDILDLDYMTIKYRDEDLPAPPQGYNPDHVLVQTSYQNLYIQSTSKIYAALIVLDAEVNIMAPEFDADYKVSTRAGKTYVLFYNLDDSYLAPGMIHILRYSGDANLESIQLCSEYATLLPIYYSN